MTERLKKAVMGIAALVALALGGAARAQAGDSGSGAGCAQPPRRPTAWRNWRRTCW